MKPSARKTWTAIVVLLAFLGMMLFGFATVAAAPPPTEEEAAGLKMPPPEVIDPRYQSLEQFFQKFKCPQPANVKEYIEAADKYALDYRLLPAISIQESTCGIHVPHWCPKGRLSNNLWGFREQCYDNVPAAIDSVMSQIKTTRPFAGNTIKKILWYYNGIVNPAYPGQVESLMRQIATSTIE